MSSPVYVCEVTGGRCRALILSEDTFRKHWRATIIVMFLIFVNIMFILSLDVLLLLLLLLLYLSSLCRIFTIVYLQQTMCLRYIVAAVLYLRFVLHVILFHMLNVLYFYISTSRSMCVVPSMAHFCSYLISCFLCMFLQCFL